MGAPRSFPVFALHTVLFPGGHLALQVFEHRYLGLMDEVLPDGRFVIAAIRRGREVAGPAETYRVGVVVGVEDYEASTDGSFRLEVRAGERVALIERLPDPAPFPRWAIEPYPDEGGAGTDDVEAASHALRTYLAATGDHDRPVIPHDPVAASWTIAAAVPGLVPARQALLEVAGAGERLRRSRDAFRIETRLVRSLGSGAAGPDPAVSSN